MPQLTAEELQQLVREGYIGGITIDTTVFDRLGGNLDSASLLAFSQFGGTLVSFLLTDIVANEMRAHMRRAAIESTAKLRGALKGYQRAREASRSSIVEAGEKLGIDNDIELEILRKWDRFVSETYVTEISAGQYLDNDGLVASYFACEAPFEDRKDKKYEFPDAISLLELEAWAKEEKRVVLAISHDSGWVAYGRGSKRIVVVDDLAGALALFHNEETFFAERAAALLSDESSVLYENIENALRAYVANISPHVYFESPYFGDSTYLGGEYLGRREISPIDILVIASSSNIVTLRFTVVMEISARASFGFFLADGTYFIPVGASVVERRVRLDAPVVVEMRRQMEIGQSADSVCVDAAFDVEFDFGDIEPDLDSGN